ncbi:lysocardiolipin acyltransferase 1-like [Mercenaria mercenaria]|uniref:lysocardiolipin acyltransferase 1-like n=1 Tax=Mercenaria mercenaria TaxID=6596 RepID=UPI001E1D297B|nr:lysocardiolipin acyltransferase 1-like [Mercenaria mercenaria]
MAKTNLDYYWQCFRGVSFVFLIFFSTYFGTIFILTPFLPLYFVAPVFARSITDKIIWCWKLYCVSIYEVIFQTKVRIYGNVPSNEAANLMIMNHRTRFDWLYLFSYQVRHASLRRYAISLKNGLKFLPGIGWAMQIAGFVFLDRKWEDDQETISRCLQVFKHTNYKPQILLFPEGTDLTKNTKKRSDAHAEKYSLPKYDFVLHPRTTGFTHFVQEMKKNEILDCVTDITIAYPGTIPQNEMDIIKGNFPSEIHFLIDWYPNKDIPIHKDDLDNWCKEKWSQKEAVLKEFYERKTFEKGVEELYSNESLIGALFMYSWVTWTTWHVFITYMLWSHPVLWLYVIACTIMYVCVSKYTQGFNLLIAKAMNIQ